MQLVHSILAYIRDDESIGDQEGMLLFLVSCETTALQKQDSNRACRGGIALTSSKSNKNGTVKSDGVLMAAKLHVVYAQTRLAIQLFLVYLYQRGQLTKKFAIWKPGSGSFYAAPQEDQGRFALTI